MSPARASANGSSLRPIGLPTDLSRLIGRAEVLEELEGLLPPSFHSEYSGEPPERIVELAKNDVAYINGLLGK